MRLMKPTMRETVADLFLRLLKYGENKGDFNNRMVGILEKSSPEDMKKFGELFIKSLQEAKTLEFTDDPKKQKEEEERVNAIMRKNFNSKEGIEVFRRVLKKLNANPSNREEFLKIYKGTPVEGVALDFLNYFITGGGSEKTSEITQPEIKKVKDEVNAKIVGLEDTINKLKDNIDKLLKSHPELSDKYWSEGRSSENIRIIEPLPTNINQKTETQQQTQTKNDESIFNLTKKEKILFGTAFALIFINLIIGLHNNYIIRK